MEKGEVLFTSYESLTPELISNYDIKLHITRDVNKGIRRDFIHVPQLSPSRELRNKAIYKWKKLKFTNKEIEFLKNSPTGTWFDLYEPEFQKQMNTDLDFQKCFNRIKEHLDNGKKIIAVCYCVDKYKCHRKIIHEQLIKEGYNSILQ